MNTTASPPAWQRALDLLRRPAAQAAPPLPPKGPKGGKADPTWTQARVEAEAALAAISEERSQASNVIATAGERREALFMQPDFDAAILAIDGEIDRANLQLERLERVEPELRRRLGEIKYNERGARWEKLRDEAAEKMEVFSNAVAEYHRQWEAWAAIFEQVTGQFPDADKILPRLPSMERQHATFAEQLALFRTRVIVLAQPEPAIYHTLQNYIDSARVTGEIHPTCPLDWRADVERACRSIVSVELLCPFTDETYQTHKTGDVLRVGYEHANRLVMSGRAIFRDEG